MVGFSGQIVRILRVKMIEIGRKGFFFFVTFWVVFFSQTRSHLFSNDVIVVQIFFFSFSFGLFDSILLLF